MIFKRKKLYSIILIMIIILLYTKIWLSPDEQFTINLVNHNFMSIIKLDSFDVHPPLYYLLLKTFLSITFANKFNLVIIIIFSRIFSLICSILLCIYINKIFKLIGFHLNTINLMLLLTIIPNSLGYDNTSLQPVIDIRMYSLAALFVVLTWYFLIKHTITGNNKYLILILFFSICSEYTHYFSAMMSGILLFLYCILYIIRHQYKKSLSIILIGILFFISYIPWIFYSAAKQFNKVSSGNYWISNSALLKNLIIICFIIILLLIPYYSLRQRISNIYKAHLDIIIYMNIIVLLISYSISVYKQPILLLRYMYPSIIIYELIVFSYILYLFYNNIINNKFIFMILLLLVSSFLFSFTREIFYVFPINIKIDNIYMKMDNINHYKVSIDTLKKPKLELENKNPTIDTLDVQYVMYLYSIHKNVVIDNKTKAKILYPNNPPSIRVYRYLNKIMINIK